MEGGDIPEAKRARRSPGAAEKPSEKEPRHAAKQQHQQQHLQQQQQVGVQEDSTPAAGAGSRSMTARPEGAPDEGEEDTLFDDPEEGLGEELEGLLRIEPATRWLRKSRSTPLSIPRPSASSSNRRLLDWPRTRGARTSRR